MLVDIAVAGARLALNHLRAEARTARAGLAWIVVSPAIYVGTFIVLREIVADAGLSIDGDSANPALFALIGVLVFQCWFEAIDLQSGAISDNREFIKNVGVDVRVFFVANLIRSLIMTGVRFLLALAFLAYAGAWSSPVGVTLGLLAAMVATMLNGHAIGFLLAPVSSLYRDVKHALGAVSLVLLVASGAFAVPAGLLDGAAWWAFAVNPAAVGIDVARAAALSAPLSLGLPFALWCVLLPALVWLSFSFVAAARPIVAERL